MARSPNNDKTCIVCGAGYPSWKRYKFCSRECQKRDTDKRLGIGVGVRVGFLTMIAPCGPSGRPRERWSCKCDCGNYIEKAKSSIVARSYGASCGCRRVEALSIRHAEKIKSRIGDPDHRKKILKAQVGIYRKNAESRSLEFSISEDNAIFLMDGDCYYCGEPPSLTGDSRPEWVVSRNGIDRADNDIGYIDGNCVSCCSKCNRAKNNESMRDFINRCKKVAARHASEEVLNAA